MSFIRLCVAGVHLTVLGRARQIARAEYLERIAMTEPDTFFAGKIYIFSGAEMNDFLAIF